MSAFNSRPIVAKHVDVLLGRGRGSYEHRGNVAFMKMISAYLPAYIAATKNKDKIRITVEIMSLVKNSGGRFLASDDRVLYEVSDAEARSKVSQALRHQRSLLIRDKKSKGNSQVSGAPTRPRMTANSKSRITKSLKPKFAESPRIRVGVASKQRAVIECGEDVGNDHSHKIGGKVGSNSSPPTRQEQQLVDLEMLQTKVLAATRCPNRLSPFQQETQLSLELQGPNCATPIHKEQQIVAFDLPLQKLTLQLQGNQLYKDIDLDDVSEFSLVEILDDEFQCWS